MSDLKNANVKEHGFSTVAVHAGQSPSPKYASVMTPIYATTTYAQVYPGEKEGFEYGRSYNPTREALESNLAALEGGEHGLSFSSGCAATSAILHLLKRGAKVLAVDDIYGGTYRLLSEIFNEMQIESKFYDLTKDDAEKVISEMKPDVLWLESPTNPQLKVIDIKKLSKAAKENGAMVVVDNTFSSPVIQKPLSLGADIVLHSTTKYIGGHSDVLGGALILNDKALFDRLKYIQKRVGAVPSPFDCYLLLRSTKTLSLRVERQSFNALEFSNYISTHAHVKRVLYPHHQSHPNYSVAKSQMSMGGGIVSVEFKYSQNQIWDFLKNLKLITLAESLGAVESLVDHPATMTHASIPKEEREKVGITDGLLRFSIGVEDIKDIISDLNQALGKVR